MVRRTRQRDSIRAVLVDAGRPLSASEILDGASHAIPGLGIATVYRTLKSLQEESWLDVVELPGEPPRYEPAGKAHHDHFRCRRCARLYEVDHCPVIQAALPSGFVLEGHSALLTGLCAACAPGARLNTGRGTPVQPSQPRSPPRPRGPRRRPRRGS